MSLRDELRTIYDTNGRLTAELVVTSAKPASHPLHDQFEWNDKIAGPKYRLVQAERLIRRAKVVYVESETEEPRTVRSWHALHADGHYQPVEEVATDPELTDLLLRQMARDWQTLRRRYGHMAEFIELVQASIVEAA